MVSHRNSIAGPSTVAVGSASGPTVLPAPHAESKRDRKRRETINKIELLHDESWRTRDEKFSQLYKDYHNENRAVANQPPTSAQYFLKLYPYSLERDALREAAEIEYQYRSDQAKRAYEAEREGIEAQYWDARDQVRARLLGAIEERRRKLREEKEGGDVITEALIEASVKAKPTRRTPFRNRVPQPKGSSTPNKDSTGTSSPLTSPPDNIPKNDILLHSLLAPALAQINVDDILSSSSSSLAVLPALGPSNYNANPKRGPRGKDTSANKEGETAPAPGTATALAIASGQQAPRANGRGAGASQGQWVLGKSLAELKKMESASQLEIESDWARIQGTGGRGRRTRGD